MNALFPVSSLRRTSWTARRRRSGVRSAAVLLGLPLSDPSPMGAVDETGSGWPGFTMSGDVRKLSLPSFVAGDRRFWHSGMPVIDLLSGDGASVSAFRANLGPYDSPGPLPHLVLDISNLSEAAVAGSLIHMAQTAAALCRCMLLGRRFLRPRMAASVLFASLFCPARQAAA